MADIFKLVGSIFVDTDKANESLSKTDKKAEGLGGTLLDAAGKAGKFALGIGAAATGAAVKMISMAKDTASTADEIDKASQRMKIGAETYQELAHAASLSGVEMSALEKAAKKLEGTDLSFDDAIAQIYELGTAEERSAAASELFGEAVAYQMTPMLNASGEEMAAMRQEARDLGLVMSEDTVKSGAELNDAIQKVTDSVKMLGTNLGGALMPLITDMCNEIIAFMPTFIQIADHLAPILVDLMQTLLPVLMDVAKQVLPPILQIVMSLLPLFKTLCDLILPLLTKLITFIANFIVDIVIPTITKIITIIKDAIAKAPAMFEKFKQTILNTFNQIKEGIKTPINAVIGMINKMIGALNALKFDIPEWVPVLGGKTFGLNLQQIPLLANGGSVTAPGSAIVGEAGAELIDMPKGATVTPLTRGETALNADKILEVLQTMQSQNLAFYLAFEDSIKAALNNVGVKWDDRELARLIRTYA